MVAGPGAGEPPPLIEAGAELDVAVFAHGVASGAPLVDQVILWTRLEPAALGLAGEEDLHSASAAMRAENMAK